MSYVISCSSRFRDQVLNLAERRKSSPADLARAVLLLVPAETLARLPDPGEPEPQDRERVELRSGASRGRVLKRKPRLQMRLPAGYGHAELRRALALALSMESGESEISVVTPSDRKAEAAVEKARDDLSAENATLRSLIDDLATPILAKGIQTRGDALFVLGLPPTTIADRSAVRQRWRRLAMIYHPDSAFGDHERMTQLNEALERLTQ